MDFFKNIYNKLAPKLPTHEREFDFGQRVWVNDNSLEEFPVSFHGMVVGFNSTRNTYLLIVAPKHSKYMITFGEALESSEKNTSEKYEFGLHWWMEKTNDATVRWARKDVIFNLADISKLRKHESGQL
jgi:hypothetical protein